MKVVVFPYDYANPYQRSLYDAMESTYPETKVLRLRLRAYIGTFIVIFRLLIHRLQGYKILHVHWIAFYLQVRAPGYKWLSYYLTRFCLWWIKILGYSVVWTVHDVTPHEQETKDDTDISRRFSSMCSYKIIHSEYTRSQLESKGINADNCIVIPHGNYDGCYPQDYDRSEAREKLGLGSKQTVFLFLGSIRPYKGIDDLLLAYSAVKTNDNCLIIAGNVADVKLDQLIKTAVVQDGVMYRPGYVDDRQVAMYYQAADVVCLPFKAITTSGSALLALTFGKPLIAPLLGALTEYPANVGKLYNPNDSDALVHAMRFMIERPADLTKMSKAARKYAQTLDWETIARKTQEIYHSV